MLKLSAEQEAATAIAENLAVVAGAGSGKTTVLTARYLRLLEEGGLDPGQIVAITFTKKAAREMRERIDAALAKKAASGELRWKLARDLLVQAPISTIHAFYARILKAFPVEAGIDPSFRVLDELETRVMLDQALVSAINEAREENCPHLTLLTEVLGAQALEEDGGLAVQLRQIYTHLRNKGIPVEEAGLSARYQETDWRSCRDRLCAITAGAEELAAALGSKDKPQLAGPRRALAEAGQILRGVESSPDLVKLYRYLLPLTRLTGGNTKGHKEYVNASVAQLRQLLSGGLAPVLGQAALALLIRLDNAFRACKGKAGGLDFSDLQFAVLRLLESHPQVISSLRHRFRTYMIDEFQDTDRLQHRIIKKLVEDQGGIPSGRLFVVGDEKQSIYRFRGAEVRVFNEVRQQLIAADPLAEKHITCNYRSRQPLIDMINDLFSRLMDGSSYISLTPNRTWQQPCAELLQCPGKTGEESAAEAEARLLARRIREMVAGRQKIAADAEGNPRAVHYGDIAVLLRARTNIREYEHQLRLAGVPYTVIGGVGFYQQQEVRDMVNLLKAVNNLRDELALAAALRSPLFALDDDSLAALAQAKREKGGSLLEHGSVLDTEQQERLIKAQSVVNTLREARGRLEMSRLVELALDLTQFREVNLTRFAGLQRYANLEKLVELAGQYSAGGNHTLLGFLQWLKLAAEQDEAEAPVDDEGADTVRIMTIHASKGLEFPVVFLPVCSSKLSTRPGSLLLDAQGMLAFKMAWACPIWEEVLAWEKERELEEYKRLLYVAVTRARDWLVLIVQEPGEQETNSFNFWLQDFAAQSGRHFAAARAELAAGPRICLPTPLPNPGPKSAWQPEQDFPGLARVGSGARTFRYFNISQFLLWKRDRNEFDRRYLSRWVNLESRGLEERELDWQHEPGGAKFGTLLHAALELIEPGTNIAALLEELVPRCFPDAGRKQRDRVLSSARILLESHQLEPGPAGKFTEAQSELEFYYRLGDALFYGLMDRILIGGDHVAVLDYKTNLIPETGIQPLVDAYAPQLCFYALAAAKIYQRPVRAYLQLLRLPPGRQTVEISVTNSEQTRLLTELNGFLDYCSGSNLAPD